MPLLTRLGLIVFVLAGAGDIVGHLAEAAGPAAEHAAHEVDAHLGIFVGMVLIFAGVVVDGVRQSLHRRPAGRTRGVA